MLKIEHGKYYHIYNRGNNSQDIFFESKNYEYFLKLVNKYIEPVAEIYAWCLLKNHFHFLVYIKLESEIDFQKLEYSTIDKPKKLSISKQFSNLFSSYTLSINKKYNRTGSLFEKNFERKCINHQKYLLNLIHYINYNPVLHRIVKNPLEYPWSSYIGTISEKPTKIQREKIISIFGSKENFINSHNKDFSYEYIQHFLID